MPNFIFISLPVCDVDHRYFTAAYVAGIIKKAGWDFKYLDLNQLLYSALSTDETVKSFWNVSKQPELLAHIKVPTRNFFDEVFSREIIEFKPDLIGFSLMSSNRYFVYAALECLDELRCHVPILYGGPDCFPREYSKAYFNAPLTPDIMLQGEAEIALPEFLHEYEKTGDYKTKINGFVFKNVDGVLVDTGLPQLPYLKGGAALADYTIFDYSKTLTRDHNLFTFASKGCINKCAFCSESRNYQPYRRRQAEEVIGEIEQNIFALPPTLNKTIVVNFRDSIFNASADYVLKVSQLIIDRKLHVQWSCLGAFKTGLAEDLLALMYRSGCRNIFFGFESASQRVIDLMGKDFDINYAQKVIELCLAQKITVTLPIINGFPGEFVRDFLVNIAFICKYRDKDGLSFGFSNTCAVRNQVPLSDFPDDFLIDEIDEARFILRDGYNNYHLRQFRQTINEALIKKKDIATENLLAMNFNESSVAAEIVQLCYFISVFIGKETIFNELLMSQWFVADSRHADNCPRKQNEQRYLDRIIPRFDLRGWFLADKNVEIVKNEIINSLRQLIEGLGTKMRSTDAVDFKNFRELLYCSLAHFDKFNKIEKRLPGWIKIISMRLSGYDKGKHIIFEGVIDEVFDGKYVSRIEARCGRYCFDVHHGVRNFLTKGYPQKNTSIGFWGKVGRELAASNGIILQVIFNDNSLRSFRLGKGCMEEMFCPQGFVGFFRKLDKLSAKRFLRMDSLFSWLN